MRKVRLYPVLRDHDDNEEDEKVKVDNYIYLLSIVNHVMQFE